MNRAAMTEPDMQPSTFWRIFWGAAFPILKRVRR